MRAVASGPEFTAIPTDRGFQFSPVSISSEILRRPACIPLPGAGKKFDAWMNRNRHEARLKGIEPTREGCRERLLLFDTEPHAAEVLGFVVAYFPARRSARMEPMQALWMEHQ